MFRVMDVGPDGAAVVTDGDALVRPPGQGTIRWIDLRGQTEADMTLLGERFGFHPLALEDCIHVDQRPKLDEYDGYLFIVIHAFRCPSGNAREMLPQELHAFLGQGYLVTVHAEDIAPLDTAWKRVAGDAALARRGADFLYYLIADKVVDANFALLDLLSDALEEIEDGVLGGAQTHDLQHIFALKHTLVGMRRTLSPERDVFSLLCKRGSALVSERTALYFRVVYDHLVRIYESIDSARDLLGNALDAYLSMVAQRTNEIMKRLTILSAVFLPLTFVTGFFGMNLKALPIEHDWLMWIVTGLCVVVPTGMLVYFRRQRWL